MMEAETVSVATFSPNWSPEKTSLHLVLLKLQVLRRLPVRTPRPSPVTSGNNGLARMGKALAARTASRWLVQFLPRDDQRYGAAVQRALRQSVWRTELLHCSGGTLSVTLKTNSDFISRLLLRLLKVYGGANEPLQTIILAGTLMNLNLFLLEWHTYI